MAQTYIVQLKNGTQTTVANVLSESFVDQDTYDLTNYRFLLDAGKLGRAWNTSLATPYVSPGEPENSDEDYTKTAPHAEIKKRSRYVLWSGAGGTGDKLFWAWADLVIDVSISTHTFV